MTAWPLGSLESPFVSAATAASRRILPHGYRDLFLQLAIWFGFLYAYRVTRGVADRNAYEAFENGLAIANVERGLTGLWELSLQSFVHSSDLLMTLTSWTYWQSQFTVLGIALFWVYLRRNHAFAKWRNTIILANMIGLVGFVVMPVAPPRMFPDLGFVDTLAVFSDVNHSSTLIAFAANPYAAMPSLHAADAFIVGIAMALIVRRWVFKALWLAWPLWVSFTVIATGNHFWLDIAAGVLVAAIAAAILHGRKLHARLVARG
jgi:membrane-associated phospholipid phosphatase